VHVTDHQVYHNPCLPISSAVLNAAVRELVAVIRRLEAPSHHKAALEALHALFIHAGAGACVAAYDAYVAPLLLTAMEAPMQSVRHLAVRLVGLLMKHVPNVIPNLLQQSAVAALLKLLQRSMLAERAEALDILYMLRTYPTARREIAAGGVMPQFAAILDACVDLAPQQLASGGAVEEEREHAGRVLASPALACAASIGLFLEPQELGSKLHRATVAGKTVRLLVCLAHDPYSWHCVAECAALAEPLARLVGDSASSASNDCSGEKFYNAPFRVHNTTNALPSVVMPVAKKGISNGREGAQPSRQISRTDGEPAPVVDVPEAMLQKIERSMSGTGTRAPNLQVRSAFTLSYSQLRRLCLKKLKRPHNCVLVSTACCLPCSMPPQQQRPGPVNGTGCGAQGVLYNNRAGSRAAAELDA
jgi:hypothetical protein